MPRYRVICHACDQDYIGTTQPGRLAAPARPPRICGACGSRRIFTRPAPEPTDTIEDAIGSLLAIARSAREYLEHLTLDETDDSRAIALDLRDAIEDIETWIAMDEGDYQLRRAALDSQGEP